MNIHAQLLHPSYVVRTVCFATAMTNHCQRLFFCSHWIADHWQTWQLCYNDSCPLNLNTVRKALRAGQKRLTGLILAPGPYVGHPTIGELQRMSWHSIHITDTHTHSRLTALCQELPGWASTRKVKPIWILLKRETVSGISWAICKSALRSRQTTTPAPHHSSFLQAGCPSCRPTVSKHWRPFILQSRL